MNDLHPTLQRGEILLTELLTLSLDREVIDFGHVWLALDVAVRAEIASLGTPAA